MRNIINSAVKLSVMNLRIAILVSGAALSIASPAGAATLADASPGSPAATTCNETLKCGCWYGYWIWDATVKGWKWSWVWQPCKGVVVS